MQETGLYDYGWRMYMPDIGRWNGMDQLAESYNSYSPYAYVMNNPVSFFDPDGRVSADFFTSFWNSTLDGTNSYWKNTGSSFIGSNDVEVGYDGGYISLNINYTNGGLGEKIINLENVTLYAKGHKKYDNWANAENLPYNQAVLFSGILGALEDWNFQQNFSNYHSKVGNPIDDLQGALDGLGYIPVIGDFMDGANALISLGRGDYVGAIGSAVAIIPLVGSPLKGTVKNLLKTESKTIEGIYEFVAKSGKTYVGQSGDIMKRLQQHIDSGKLPEGTQVIIKEVLGGKTVREIAEQLRIRELGGIYQNGVKVLENYRNPIGPARQHLMP